MVTTDASHTSILVVILPFTYSSARTILALCVIIINICLVGSRIQKITNNVVGRYVSSLLPLLTHPNNIISIVMLVLFYSFLFLFLELVTTIESKTPKRSRQLLVVYKIVLKFTVFFRKLA